MVATKLLHLLVVRQVDAARKKKLRVRSRTTCSVGFPVPIDKLTHNQSKLTEQLGQHSVHTKMKNSTTVV